MTEKLAPKKPVTAKAENKKEPLLTGWADAQIEPNFDHDQAAVHEWVEHDTKAREEILVSKMTIADAEELIATAENVAAEHSKRSRQALALAETVAKRLGIAHVKRFGEPEQDVITEEPERPQGQKPQTAPTQVLHQTDPRSAVSIPGFLQQDDVAKAN